MRKTGRIVLALAFAFLLTFALAACGGKGGKGTLTAKNYTPAQTYNAGQMISINLSNFFENTTDQRIAYTANKGQVSIVSGTWTWNPVTADAGENEIKIDATIASMNLAATCTFIINVAISEYVNSSAWRIEAIPEDMFTLYTNNGLEAGQLGVIIKEAYNYQNIRRDMTATERALFDGGAEVEYNFTVNNIGPEDITLRMNFFEQRNFPEGLFASTDSLAAQDRIVLKKGTHSYSFKMAKTGGHLTYQARWFELMIGSGYSNNIADAVNGHIIILNEGFSLVTA